MISWHSQTSSDNENLESVVTVVTITKYHKSSGLKHQKCLLSQFWRLEIQNQCVGRATLPLKPLREDASWSLPPPESPRCSLACGSTTSISPSIFTWPYSLYVSICISSLSLSLFLRLFIYS
ncbi:unnamed protein product [Nyctereutes procyonoides]|uniref:(raccoon dog) hypothetical protein n=1 Tax=Nyctereutes procyonoides TaxID=34880 RepID=A0A811ZHH0_NYCPR|nr:unnamed protein product [Nyctereutes procyonoides]CAD7688140.1 unnamed protein product [Nyctereutes procyonoides]